MIPFPISFLSQFNPKMLPNLGLWLRSDLGITLSGSLVTNWDDQSGNGRDWTAAGSARPTFVTNGVFGKPVVRFDGTANEMSSTVGLDLFRDLAGTSVFVVCKDSLPMGGGTQHNVLIYTNGISNAAARLLVTTRRSGNNFEVGGRRLDADSFRTVSTPNDGGWNVINGIISYSANNNELFINNVSKGTNTISASGGNTSNTDSMLAVIGSGGPTTAFFPGDITEIIVYQRAITSIERTRVHNYLKNRYLI